MPKQSQPVTVEQVRSTIDSSMEALEPQTTIIAFLREHEGRKLYKPLADKLSERLGVRCFFSGSAGSFSSLELKVDKPGGYHTFYMGRDRDGNGFNVANPDAFTKANPSLFMDDGSSRCEYRNNQRRAVLADAGRIEAMANAINTFHQAHQTLQETLDEAHSESCYISDLAPNFKRW